MKSFGDNAKDVLFWAKLRMGMPEKERAFRSLLANQELSLDELNEMNWQKRLCMVRYAYEHVPFYRRKYSAAGLDPGDIKSPEDFYKLPIVQKDELRDCAHEMLSDEARPRLMAVSTTGGSTGIPVKVMHDRRFHFEALLWRMMYWWGVSPGANSAYVLRQRRKTLRARVTNAAMWWPTNRAHLDASLMTEPSMLRFVKELRASSPRLLQGYVGSVYHLACFIERNALEVPAPHAVWVTSSPLSKIQRQKIQHVFRAPVYDQYGSGEVFAMAAQCEAQQGLHVFWDSRFLEFQTSHGEPANDGAHGDVLITDLENKVFPLIRYKNGDVGRYLQSQCSCGRNFPVIDSIRGRTTDCIALPDGSKVSGDYLTTIFDDFPECVEAFQIRQTKDYSVTVRYVPVSGADRLVEALGVVKRELEKRCCDQAKVLLEPVDCIPHDRGKLRFVVSELD